MERRAWLSEVKLKVRRNALLLREFTVADLVRATGLNPESIRTELMRMKADRFITSEKTPKKANRKGNRPALYKLVEDAEKRLALSESIDAFYETPAEAEQPTSRHYRQAQALIDEAQRVETSKRKSLLDAAERELSKAEQAEGGTLAPEIVKAYLRFESARLLYWRGKREQAWQALDDAYQYFKDTQQESVVRCIQEYRICLQASGQNLRDVPGPRSASALARQARHLVGAITQEEGYETDSPVMLMLIELVQQLSESAGEETRVATYGRVAEIKHFAMHGRDDIGRGNTGWMSQILNPPIIWPDDMERGYINLVTWKENIGMREVPQTLRSQPMRKRGDE